MRALAASFAAPAVLTRFAAQAVSEDDDEEEDEIPDMGRPRPKKAKSNKGSQTPRTAVGPEDGKQAALELLAARQKLDSADALLGKGDFAALKLLLDSPPVSSFEENALLLVQSRTLDPEDVKAIGTIKRFGIGADVIIMLGGLKEASNNLDASNARSYLAKARNSLDEIIAICKSNKLL